MTDLLAQAVVPSPESYRFISLTQGQLAIVDAADFDWLNQWMWSAAKVSGKMYYAQRGGNPRVLMHRLIAETPRRKICDHWNGDTLDNRRCNLRNIPPAANNLNRPLRSTSVTGVKGVYPAPSGRFRVRLRVGGRSINGGKYFDTIAEAESARDKLLSPYSRKGAPARIERPAYLQVERAHLQALNTSGITGISKMGRGWRLCLNLDGDGTQRYCGYFTELEAAERARLEILERHS